MKLFYWKSDKCQLQSFFCMAMTQAEAVESMSKHIKKEKIKYPNVTCLNEWPDEYRLTIFGPKEIVIVDGEYV